MDIDAIKRDMEAGTPGPWRIKDCDSMGDRCTYYYQEIWNDETDILVTTEVTRAHNDGGKVNMRRIARVPEMEAALIALQARVAELEAANRGLVRLNEATEARAEAAEAKLVKALEPDYCYDDEWEYTMPYDQWPELFDGAEVGTVHALHTLIKGPTFYVVEVPVDTNGDGEPDDWEWRKFNSREEADAFLAEIGEGHE